MNNSWSKVLLSAAVVVLTQVATVMAQQAMEVALEKVRNRQLKDRKA
tara:strand:+ start:11372 stop:11512 length:141 start_codon:yes stop_codon:yes gene_type:complete